MKIVFKVLKFGLLAAVLVLPSFSQTDSKQTVTSTPVASQPVPSIDNADDDRYRIGFQDTLDVQVFNTGSFRKE